MKPADYRLADPATLRLTYPQRRALLAAVAGQHSVLAIGTRGGIQTAFVQAVIALLPDPIPGTPTKAIRVWHPNSGTIHLADLVVVIENLPDHDPANLTAVFARRDWLDRQPLILATAYGCPCGGMAAQGLLHECYCTPEQRTAWKGRLTRYAEQFDLVLALDGQLTVPADDPPGGEAYADILAEVAAHPAPSMLFNTEITTAQKYARKVFPRRYVRLLNVAATLARLDGEAQVLAQHVDAAYEYLYTISPEY